MPAAEPGLFWPPPDAPLASLLGGALIGLAAALLWLVNGRVAGISGISGGLIDGSADRGWRLSFLLGLIAGGLAMSRLTPAAFEPAPVALGVAGLAGLLVGVGTTLANGCTSGHGVCGVARLSPRSLVATASFLASGVLTVYVARHLVGGG